MVNRYLVRCAVLCLCGDLRDDEHGTAVTVPTKNPNRSEVDPQPEPDQASWAKLSITAEGSDGGIVEAEIIRPRSWILASGLCARRMLPLNLPAPYRVLGTDLGDLFASIRPGSPPGAWHRFGGPVC